jgi:hypothetical protein
MEKEKKSDDLKNKSIHTVLNNTIVVYIARVHVA